MAVNFTASLRSLQIRCVWNCSVCTSAWRIRDGLNFTAFLCSVPSLTQCILHYIAYSLQIHVRRDKVIFFKINEMVWKSRKFSL